MFQKTTRTIGIEKHIKGPLPNLQFLCFSIPRGDVSLSPWALASFSELQTALVKMLLKKDIQLQMT